MNAKQLLYHTFPWEERPGIVNVEEKGNGMAEDHTYNGWTNRATWLVNLHITNDEGLFHLALDRVAGLDVHAAAAGLRELVEEVLGYGEGDAFIDDLVGHMLADVELAGDRRGLR